MASGNILIFDTETTGLPKFKKKNIYQKETTPFDSYHEPSKSFFYESSRLIELGYLIYSPDRALMISKSLIVKPDGFLIQNSDIHGIEHDNAMQNGRPIKDVLTDFANDIASCSVIVAHNLPFDYSILLAECYRIKDNFSVANIIINKFKVIEKFCTMTDTMRIMNLTRRPKLSILYQDLTKNTWEQKHRAEDDAKACAECYWKLLDIQKDNYQQMINA